MSWSRKPYVTISPSIMFTGLVSGLGYVRTVVCLEEAQALRVSIDLPYAD